MTVRSPSLYAAGAVLRHAVVRRHGRLRRDVGRVAAVLQHAVGRVGSRRHRLPHRRRRQGHEVLRRLVDRRRRRVFARARLPFARGLGRRAHVDADDRNRTLRVRLRRQRATHRPRERPSRAATAAQHARFPGRHHAGRCRRRRSCSRTSRTRTATATTPIRTSRSTRGPTTAASSRGSRATTSTSPAADATLRAVATATSTIRSATDSSMLEAAWVQPLPAGFTRDAERALLHAGRRELLLRPAVSAGLRPRPSRTRRTRGSRRSARSPRACGSRKAFADGWSADLSRRLLPPALGLARRSASGSPGLADRSRRAGSTRSASTKTF